MLSQACISQVYIVIAHANLRNIYFVHPRYSDCKSSSLSKPPWPPCSANHIRSLYQTLDLPLPSKLFMESVAKILTFDRSRGGAHFVP